MIILFQNASDTQWVLLASLVTNTNEPLSQRHEIASYNIQQVIARAQRPEQPVNGYSIFSSAMIYTNLTF